MKEFEIEIYRDENGQSQLAEFIANMDNKTRSNFIAYTRLLSNKGDAIREPYSKNLEDGIFELRINISFKFTRVLYFFVKDKKIIMTNGFIKKTNKTPRKEIEKAIKYKKEYINRSKLYG